MPVTSTDLFALARELRESPDEVARLSSTSRLYYGVLHRAIECLQDVSPAFERPRVGSTFGWIQDRFIERSPPHRHMLNLLRELKDERQHADYDIDQGDWSLAQVESAERVARRVARLLDEITAHPLGQDPALTLLS